LEEASMFDLSVLALVLVGLTIIARRPSPERTVATTTLPRTPAVNWRALEIPTYRRRGIVLAHAPNPSGAAPVRRRDDGRTSPC
jgi:hypothetical protein